MATLLPHARSNGQLTRFKRSTAQDTMEYAVNAASDLNDYANC
jgi:hypothetical protein